MAVEVWRSIPGYSGYEASDQGRIRSTDRVVETVRGPRRYRGKVLSPGKTASDHFTVALGKGRSVYVHVAVLRTFVGEPSTGQEACHGNGDPADNRLTNLRWDTHSENGREVARHEGRRLSADQVRSARDRYVPFCRENGAAAIAAEMRVSKTVMAKAISGELYAGVT